MTATRRAATIAALAVVWLVSAALLSRTRVPGGLDLAALDARHYFSAAHLRRSERYESFLRADVLLAAAAQLVVVICVAMKAPRLAGWLPGGAIARGIQLALLTFAALWLVRLPFGLAALWWRRRYGIAREGYLDWLVAPWSTLLAEVLLGCLAVAGLMLLARRLGQRWWLAGAAIVAALGAGYVVVQPLVLAPRFAPLHEQAIRADVESIARRLGVGDVEVRLRKAHERTRAVNAEVVGIGPTRRVVLWDTLLEGQFTRSEIKAISAHELAHVRRLHVWKGLAWFLLVVAPAVWLIDRVALLRGGLVYPAAVPAAIATALALQLLLTPAIDLVTRRYEAEADWVALSATRDPAAMRGLLRGLALANLSDPDPPRWWSVTFRTHPTILERIAMAEAWARREGRRLPPLAPSPS